MRSLSELLGVEPTGVRSWPVGYLHTVDMAPLTFEEYCWACGVPQGVLDRVREAYEAKTPLDDALHVTLVDLFRQYLVIGGMPEAVQRSVDSKGD